MYALYKSVEQARQAQRVTTAAQRGLATNTSKTVPMTHADLIAPRPLHLAPETIAGTVALWSQYAAMHNFSLRERAVALVEQPCREHGIAIEVLGEYPLFTGRILVRGTTSDVIIVPADDDPLLQSGKFPLPRQVRRRLETMRQANVPFDALYTYIAHEVPRNSVDETGPLPLALLTPPQPVASVRTTQRLGIVAHALNRTLLGGLGKATQVGAYSIGVATVGLEAMATVLLDPLIFGAIADERGMATWFVLAQWSW